MKKIVWLAVLALVGCSSGRDLMQIQSEPEYLQRSVAEIDLDEGLRSQVVGAQDQALFKAVLSDGHLFSGQRLEETVGARMTLFNISQLARDDNAIAASLREYGFEAESIYDEAVGGGNPIDFKEGLGVRLGVTQSNKIIVRSDDTLITKPETLADDRFEPGKLGGGIQKGDVVWRLGLKFAALVGVRQGSGYTATCSGTVIGAHWVVTAAHCLFDRSKGGRVGNDSLAVFLPFQGGTEVVMGVYGSKNKNMRRIQVVNAFWVGDDTSEPFPSNFSAFNSLIVQGKDLALLQLRSSDMSALALAIADVRLFHGYPAGSAFSMVGYGMSEQPATNELALLVGVRETPPAGIKRDSPILAYGNNEGDDEGGFCGGDSGGGLFDGYMDGTVVQPQLIGVISALRGTTPAMAPQICIASQQNFTSLVVPRNRDFVCKRVPAACG